MAQFHYHFSAARLPRNNVVLYITTNGVPLHLTSEEIGAVWRDIVHCFVHGGFPEAALILKTLSYKWNSFGAFEINGPLSKRRHVFRLLTDPQEHIPGVTLSVSVKFFRTYDKPHLGVHHWTGRMWDAGPAPILPKFPRPNPRRFRPNGFWTSCFRAFLSAREERPRSLGLMNAKTRAGDVLRPMLCRLKREFTGAGFSGFGFGLDFGVSNGETEASQSCGRRSPV